MSQNDTKTKLFFRKHKVKFYIIGCVLIAVGVGCLGFKYIPRNKSTQRINNIESVNGIMKPKNIELPYKELWSNLSGKCYTPTKLGEKVRMTPQKINKRLLEFNLQTRDINGDYCLTELGKKFGVDKWKVTATGHSFSNIEWDENVIQVIFTPEELDTIDEMTKKFSKI